MVKVLRFWPVTTIIIFYVSTWGNTVLAFSDFDFRPNIDMSVWTPVKELENGMSKDYPKIRDCGTDDSQNWYEPDPDDCSSYFVCTGKFYEHRRCSQGLVFDVQNEHCSWPDKVDCGDRAEPWNHPEFNPFIM